MKEKLIVLSLLCGAGFLVAIGYGPGQKPIADPAPATPTPVSVGPPPDGSLGKTNCPCVGGKCAVCACKEPGECNPPKAAVCHCGGDGLLDGPYGPLLCPTCGKGKSEQIPTFSPTLYTQPAPKPVAVQSYSSCANGSCSSGGPLRRLFRRRR